MFTNFGKTPRQKDSGKGIPNEEFKNDPRLLKISIIDDIKELRREDEDGHYWLMSDLLFPLTRYKFEGNDDDLREAILEVLDRGLIGSRVVMGEFLAHGICNTAPKMTFDVRLSAYAVMRLIFKLYVYSPFLADVWNLYDNDHFELKKLHPRRTDFDLAEYYIDYIIEHPESV